MKRVAVTDQMLYRYMPVVDDAIIRELEKDVEEYEYSERFQSKMRGLIWQEAHAWISSFIMYAKKVAIFFGCIISAALILTMSVEAYRIKLFETLETLLGDMIEYRYYSEEEEIEFRILAPKYIPEGYELYQEEIVPDNWVDYIYQNADEEWITWSQMLAEDGLTLVVDLEYDKEENVEVNGAIASVRSYDDGRCYIYYEYENYVILLWADRLSVEDTIKILESMQYK